MLLLRALAGCALAAARDGASQTAAALAHPSLSGLDAALGSGTAPRERPRGRELSVTDFGGSAAPGHNNAAAIAAAVEACRRAAGGCRLSFPARAAGEPSAAPTVYRTSSFALASEMTLHIPAGVVLRGELAP